MTFGKRDHIVLFVIMSDECEPHFSIKSLQNCFANPLAKRRGHARTFLSGVARGGLRVVDCTRAERSRQTAGFFVTQMEGMTLMKKLLLGVAMAALAAGSAFAQDMKPGVIYDLGGKFDKSFNEGVFNGASKFAKEASMELKEYELQNDGQREQALRRFAQDGISPIVVAGFMNATPIEKIAKEFPDTKFTLIDAVVELPNVQSIVFKEHEGSYLVGVLAGMASGSKKVGFVGGMDIPLISRFACGYAQGAAAAGATDVIRNMTGTTPEAWNNPVKGGELTKAQIDQGADVVYAAAGATGLGVLRTAADAGKLSIGVDSNQNGLHPGKVLTSMLKRVDVAAYKSFADAKAGSWKGGIQVLGLAEEGVDWALDDNNKALVTDAMKAAVDKAKADIIAGTVKVHNFTDDNKCPL
jgi:basic membrane protein A and related proteins